MPPNSGTMTGLIRARTWATRSARGHPSPAGVHQHGPCRKTSSRMLPGAQPRQGPRQVSLVDDAEALGCPGDGHVKVVQPGL
jgi:hypothetical protein